MNAWKTERTTYIENIYRTKGIVPGNLFRPPYGKLTRHIFGEIKRDYRVALWSLLSFDYLQNSSEQKCFNHLKKRTRPGGIVVFHDNGKLSFDLIPLIERYIDFCREQKWEPAKIV
jgi:hypothetical protein